MAKVDTSHAVIISAHTNLVTSALHLLGTNAQRQQFLRLLASGTVIGAFGLTEAESGSDAGAMATTYRDAGEFLKRLDGGRIGIAAISLGIAEGAFDLAVAWAGTSLGRLPTAE